MKIAIVGAGIGGLSAAMALHAAGHDVRVFEAVSEMRPLGVGINLLPHAVRELDALGLMDMLLAQGVATRELVYFNKFGQRIWGEPRGRAAGYDWPQISIHRGRLQMSLLATALQRLGPERIMFDHRLVAIEDADALTARFETADGNSMRIEADLLVAADGIHSAARRQAYPDEGLPCYSGRMLWRATTRGAPYLSGATMIMAGHEDQKFVAYPISAPGEDGRCVINWIAELRRPLMPDRENWNRRGRLEDFLPSFESWTFDWLDVPELMRAAEAIYEFPMVDRDPLPAWQVGRSTLLGDAAHPMYPIGSNGASQAILDAAALAEAIGSHSSVTAALARYEAVRRPATAAVAQANRSNGPEQCMQLAEERAPNGFADIEAVIPRHELEEIAARYKRLAGFDPARLKAAS